MALEPLDYARPDLQEPSPMKPWLKWTLIVICTVFFTAIAAILFGITYLDHYVTSLNIQY